MTLAEAGEIFAYWAENPPAHLLLQAIACLFGWTPHRSAAAATSLVDIAAAATPGIAIIRGAAPGMPSPLEPDALRARNRAHAAAIARRNVREAAAQ